MARMALINLPVEMQEKYGVPEEIIVEAHDDDREGHLVPIGKENGTVIDIRDLRAFLESENIELTEKNVEGICWPEDNGKCSICGASFEDKIACKNGHVVGSRYSLDFLFARDSINWIQA